MNLLVTGPAYWATEELFRKRFWLYLASCAKFGITPQVYGIGTERYEGGAEMRIYGLLEYLKTVDASYTHILFSHLWDVIFVDSVESIIEKYECFGRPSLLMGAARTTPMSNLFDIQSPEIDPYLPLFDTSQLYPYPAWSMYIAEIPYLIDRLARMDTGHHDDSIPLLNALESRLLEPVYDRCCEIFQMVMPDTTELGITRDGKVCNWLTDTYPSMLHFQTIAADQETGRDEAIVPWAQQLEII